MKRCDLQVCMQASAASVSASVSNRISCRDLRPDQKRFKSKRKFLPDFGGLQTR